MIKNQSSLIKSVIIYTVFHKSEGMIFVTSERLETHSEVILPTLCGMLTFQVHWRIFSRRMANRRQFSPTQTFPIFLKNECCSILIKAFAKTGLRLNAASNFKWETSFHLPWANSVPFFNSLLLQVHLILLFNSSINVSSYQSTQ